MKAIIVKSDGTWEEAGFSANSKKYISPNELDEKWKVELGEIIQQEIFYWCNDCKTSIGKADITDDYFCKKHGTKVYDLRDYVD